MKQRMITLALAAGCIVLGVIAFFIHTGRDREAPEIKIEKEDITYTEGDDHEVLLKGVSAKDNKDGDLTKEVFIDKIVPIKDNQAIVCYGVMDSSRNVATASRKVHYIAKEAGAMEGDGGELEAAKEEPPAETPAEETPAEENLQPNGANPVMALTANEVTIRAGETFDPLSVVRGAADDVDDVNTLYQHIHAEGEYNTGVPGTYEIRYYVSDSDGNTSEPHIFTLTVE